MRTIASKLEVVNQHLTRKAVVFEIDGKVHCSRSALFEHGASMGGRVTKHGNEAAALKAANDYLKTGK